MTIKRFQVPIFVEITAIPSPIRSGVRVEVNIAPAEAPQQTKIVKYNFNLNRLPIAINLSEPIIATANQFLEDILDVYIDEERELKTLLNYGEDKQSIALAYRRGPFDINGIETIQLKLLQPVPEDITTNTPVFLSREVAKTVIDKVRVRFTPELDTTPYLRPRNLKAKTDLDTGRFLKNVTLNKLQLQSGSVGLVDQFQNKNFEDEIFRQWYSYDFNSSELNIDFTNYSNFVFYSSAAMRLAAFKEKLKQIELLEARREQILATYTANTGSAGIIFLKEKSEDYSLQKENIIRSFDRYEQYLFFTPTGSTSAYSASFEYVDGGTEYNSIGYWPKSGSNLYPVSSDTATEWFENQYAIAQRFDEFNENNLINTIPTYLREDHESSPYLTFVTMIAQMFDSVKLYIDQFPHIYSRNLDPNDELSKDLVNDIAESIGFALPTLDSVYNLTDNILGTTDNTPRRDLAAEIYKRLLHNMPFFAKAKGTKTALETLLKTFGITSQLLTVRELGTPTSSSYQVFDEYTTGLDFDEQKTSFIRLPIQASSRNPTTLQFNFTVAKERAMTILTGDDKWALNVIRHPTISGLGRFEIRSGSANVRIVTSSYYNIFGDELLNATLQTYNNTSSLYFRQVDGDDTVFSQTIIDSNIFPSLWNVTEYVFMGGAGVRVTGRYDGTIDEVRLWNAPLSEEVIINTAFDPGSNAGDTYSDATNHLIVQHSFNKDATILLPTVNSILNESPYKDIAVSPSLQTLFSFNISGTDFIRYDRTIKQDTPLVGSSVYTTNKIVIAPPPQFISDSSGLRLYRNKSIVQPEQKRFNRGRNKVVLAMSPTDIVNQNIIRNFGLENINAVLGTPTTLYTTFDKSLTVLKNHYQKYYYVDVNTNKFIRILSDLSSVLNQVVDYFIPSKATVLKGIVIEPNILEQVKIPPIKNLRFYGKETRKTINAPGSLTGSNADYGATFNLSKEIKQSKPSSSGLYPSYTSQTDAVQSLTLQSAYTTYTSNSIIDGTNTSMLKSEYSVYGIQHDLENYSSSREPSKITVNIDKIKGEFTTITSESSTVFAQLPSLKFSEYVTYKLQHDVQNYSGSNKDLRVLAQPESAVEAQFATIASESNIRHAELPSLVLSNYDTYGIQHEKENYSGSNKSVRIDVELKTTNKIPYNRINLGSPGAEPYNRLYSRKLFTSEIAVLNGGTNAVLYTPALYDIPPSADFRDPGVYTYFNSSDGIYYFNETKKIPAYPSPLNAVWDFDNQSFNNAITSWSYGAGYNKNDVVYQDISTEYLQQINLPADLRVLGGNKRYYVFKNRPAYKTSVITGSFYSGSVPSFAPPSLDKDNWDLLRFKPIQVRSPRRVVFDTFTVTDPAENNFKVTTISVDTNINLPDRYIDRVNIGTITGNSRSTGEIALQNIALLFAVQANVGGIRLRLYRTQAARDLDILRSNETRPVGSHGVLLDTTIDGTGFVEISNPIPTLVAGESPPAGRIFYTVDNLDTTTKSSITFFLYYFAIEIETRIPKGYLRKHYRFFRDNSTATKRRNYVGCKNTVETTIDGLPPIQIFISEGTEIQVSPTTGNQEIVTGGGGTLNVT
jgi:hypothetical protein